MTLQTRIDGALAGLGCQHSFYYRLRDEQPILRQNPEIFLSASIIKAPLLLAWIALEQSGEVSRTEMCDLDAERPVQGAGLSWLLAQRTLPYADVLMLMMALSDNLCANLVIRRIGLERTNAVLRDVLGLRDSCLQRKLMDYEARARGLENWISAQDCIRLFEVRDQMAEDERAWMESLLLANTDVGLWLRNIPRDTVEFFHKTGNMEGVIHDWGYTSRSDMFLLTQSAPGDRRAYEREVFRAFDALGPLLLGEPSYS